MPNALIDSTELTAEIDAQLSEAGFDPDNDPYVGALVEPIKEALEDLNDQMESYYNRSILSLATDVDLDEKLAEFGLTRGEIGIPIDDTYENFNIYLQTGTAAEFALDENSPLVIPSDGVTILDIDGNQFYLSDDIIIEPGSFSGFAPITAGQALVGGVAIDSIVNCQVDLSKVQNLNPAKSDEVVFLCTNNKALTTPEAASTDEELVDSANLRINAMNNTNEQAITLALNNYGISDITYKRNMFGFGTLGVIVRVGDSTRISDTTIRTINSILANIAPFARVVEPEFMVVKFSCRTTFVDDELIDETKAEIGTQLDNYFTGLDLGKSIDPEDIKTLMVSIENVDTFDIVCMFIDDRPCIRIRQDAMSDQMFVLDETEPIIYVS